MALNGVKAGFMSEEEKHILKESLSAQAMAIRRQLAKQKQRTFDPHTKVVRVWDSITTLALIFTATITLFEVCVMLIHHAREHGDRSAVMDQVPPNGPNS